MTFFISISRVLFLLLTVVAFPTHILAQDKSELLADVQELVEQRKANKDERMAWWREAKFGMFIHWGIYSVPAGVYQEKKIPGIGEWIMLKAKIPVDEYSDYAKQFNPVKYDPNAWVRLAKQAGMKYIVITSKHHDGFALYDTKASAFDVVDASPYEKDLLRPLAEACRKHGIKLGFYYSQANDWHHPGGAKSTGESWDEEHKGSFDDYLRDVAQPQLEEILSTYKDLAILWWDTPRKMTPERAALLYSSLRHNPSIITNSRLGGGFPGDTSTPEQHIPATGYKNRDFEVCMTMNDTWGYKSYDHNWKSPARLIRNLVDITSKGGNYLLNVGPTAEGEIPNPSIERLKAVGRWMQDNGESIYGTKASPFAYLPWGRCTTRTQDGQTELYLHVFDWPSDHTLVVPKLANEVTSAELLVSGKSLSTEKVGGDVHIHVPAHAPDEICSVVKLTVQGIPEVGYLFPVQQADSSVLIPANRMLLHKKSYNADQQLRLASIGDIATVTNWNSEKGRLECVFKTNAPGTFEVSADVRGEHATQLKVACKPGDEFISEVSPKNIFSHISLGTVTLPKKGEYRLSLQPVSSTWKPIEVRSVKLIPKVEDSIQ